MVNMMAAATQHLVESGEVWIESPMAVRAVEVLATEALVVVVAAPTFLEEGLEEHEEEHEHEHHHHHHHEPDGDVGVAEGPGGRDGHPRRHRRQRRQLRRVERAGLLDQHLGTWCDL